MRRSFLDKAWRTSLCVSLCTSACAPTASEVATSEAPDEQIQDAGQDSQSATNTTRDAQRADSEPTADVEPYELCDGSDRVRLAIKQGGGHVDSGYAFTNPHGYQFLYVTGRCSFLAAPEVNPLASNIEGTLSDEQARQLTQVLGLTRLHGLAYVDTQSCPDAGMLSIATAAGYADCTCGCDAGAPDGVADALAATEAAFALVRTLGHSVQGPVELVAVADQVPLKQPTDALQDWPFSWPVREVAVTREQYRANVQAVLAPRALVGEDAAKARALRELFLTKMRLVELHVADGEGSYALYLRDQIEPSLAHAISSFEAQYDPWAARPLEVCRGEPQRGVQFSSADLYNGVLTTNLESGSACNLRLCWDESFNESYPVQAYLKVQNGTDMRRCSGRADSLRTDLTPLEQSFQRAYPETSVEIELGLAGYRGQLFVEDWARENAACTQLSISACAGDARCRVLSGTPFDLTRSCSGDATPVACAANPTACDDAITSARAPDGSTYWFSNACLPENFSPFYPEGGQPDALPRCRP